MRGGIKQWVSKLSKISDKNIKVYWKLRLLKNVRKYETKKFLLYSKTEFWFNVLSPGVYLKYMFPEYITLQVSRAVNIIKIFIMLPYKYKWICFQKRIYYNGIDFQSHMQKLYPNFLLFFCDIAKMRKHHFFLNRDNLCWDYFGHKI